MKIIMLLNRRDESLAKKYKYIILKRDKTIIKNLELINDQRFLEQEKGNFKFLIEKWEKYNGVRAHIVCGLHGGQLKPVHIANNIYDRKVLFQTEYNIVIKISLNDNNIKIYENRIEQNKIIGNLLQSFSFDDFFNAQVSTEHYDQIIKDALSKIMSEGFEYIRPFYAEGY